VPFVGAGPGVAPRPGCFKIRYTSTSITLVLVAVLREDRTVQEATKKQVKTTKAISPTSSLLLRHSHVNPSNFLQNDPSNPACTVKSHVWAVKCAGCGAIGRSSRRLRVGSALNKVVRSSIYLESEHRSNPA
jgi:hypothetical protein